MNFTLKVDYPTHPFPTQVSTREKMRRILKVCKVAKNTLKIALYNRGTLQVW